MHLLRKLKMILSLTCDQSTRLVSDGYERDLERHERAALGCHMLTCTGCKRMRRQFSLLHALAKHLRGKASPAGLEMPEDARQRIRQRLSE